MTHLDDGFTRLHSGTSLWQTMNPPVDYGVRPEAGTRRQADVVVIGGGVTGSFLAERLTRDGRSVIVIDRHDPFAGSTAASTALLQWELDATLLELEDRFGFSTAQSICRLSRAAVGTIRQLCAVLNIQCAFRDRRSILLSGDRLDSIDLREEHRLRGHMKIEGVFLNQADLEYQRLQGDGALLYAGSAEADPVALANGLLLAALDRGLVKILSPSTAVRYESSARGVSVETQEGEIIEAANLILANGYEMPAFVPSHIHRIASTWAIATRPLPLDSIWSSQSLIWEASDPYLYARTTHDNRVIAGGEDEDIATADKRDSLLPAKIDAVLRKLASRWECAAQVEVDFAWTGFFGTTKDSLPLIGAVPHAPNCFAAFGYGGNGITFSAIAAEMIAGVLRGTTPNLADIFSLDRDS